MAQNIIESLTFYVEHFRTRNGREGAAGKCIDKIVSKQVAAIMQNAAKGESQRFLATFGTLAHFVYSVAKISDPFTGVDIGIRGMDIHLAGQNIGVHIRTQSTCAECLRIVLDCLSEFLGNRKIICTILIFHRRGARPCAGNDIICCKNVG